MTVLPLPPWFGLGPYLRVRPVQWHTAGAMREIEDHDELVSLCDGDTLCLWAAQDGTGSGRAWVGDDGRSVVIAGPGLSRRDRLVVRGAPGVVVPMVAAALREVGPTYRPLGDQDLVDAIVAGVPGLVTGKTFGWMESRTGPPAVGGDAHWLADGELPEATALLTGTFPTSDALPGVPGVGPWAGIRDEAGRLVALAALAWSAPAVAMIAGVAVHPDVRGRGLGRAICGFILSAALDRHGGAALMVDEWNHAAIRLYQRLGMHYRPVRAAYVPQ